MKALYLSTTEDTTTVFPFPVELQGYGCAVIEMNGKIQSPRRDIVEESLAGDVKMPILQNIIRRNNIITNGQIRKVIWLKVMRPSISSIRLYITDQSGDIVSLPRNKLNCTLLFVPDPTQ